METLRDIMDANSEFEEKIFINSLHYLVHIFPDRSGELTNIDERRMGDFLRHKTVFKRLEERSKVIIAFIIKILA